MDTYDRRSRSQFVTMCISSGVAISLCAFLLIWLLPLAEGARVQAAPTGGVNAAPLSEQPNISVRGIGIVTARPDLLNMQVGVAIQNVKLADAQWLAATRMEEAMRILRDAGIAENDITTARYSVEVVMEYPHNQAPKQAGYRVTHLLSVKVRDIARAGRLLDSLVASGLNHVQGISFGFTDPSALLKQAREQAMGDAKSKAQQIATLGGVGLGAPIIIQDGGANNYVHYPRGVFFAAPGPNPGGPIVPINPGEQEVRIEMSVTYAIK